MAANLTGVYYECNGAKKLESLYKKILMITKKYPKNAAYKKNVETVLSNRLSILQESSGDRYEIENKICDGSIEMLISQAKNEFILTQKMILWKPWEPLVARPPPGQWKWPAN